MNTNTKQLTQQDIHSLIGALRRIGELANKKIVAGPGEAGPEAEIGGLSQFVASIFIRHAPEFIGCWQAVTNEYAPLCTAVAGIVRRVDGMNSVSHRVSSPADIENGLKLRVLDGGE